MIYDFLLFLFTFLQPFHVFDQARCMFPTSWRCFLLQTIAQIDEPIIEFTEILKGWSTPLFITSAVYDPRSMPWLIAPAVHTDDQPSRICWSIQWSIFQAGYIFQCKIIPSEIFSAQPRGQLFLVLGSRWSILKQWPSWWRWSSQFPWSSSSWWPQEQREKPPCHPFDKSNSLSASDQSCLAQSSPFPFD